MFGYPSSSSRGEATRRPAPRSAAVTSAFPASVPTYTSTQLARTLAMHGAASAPYATSATRDPAPPSRSGTSYGVSAAAARASGIGSTASRPGSEYSGAQLLGMRAPTTTRVIDVQVVNHAAAGRSAGSGLATSATGSSGAAAAYLRDGRPGEIVHGARTSTGSGALGASTAGTVVHSSSTMSTSVAAGTASRPSVAAGLDRRDDGLDARYSTLERDMDILMHEHGVDKGLASDTTAVSSHTGPRDASSVESSATVRHLQAELQNARALLDDMQARLVERETEIAALKQKMFAAGRATGAAVSFWQPSDWRRLAGTIADAALKVFDGNSTDLDFVQLFQEVHRDSYPRHFAAAMAQLTLRATNKAEEVMRKKRAGVACSILDASPSDPRAAALSASPAFSATVRGMLEHVFDSAFPWAEMSTDVIHGWLTALWERRVLRMTADSVLGRRDRSVQGLRDYVELLLKLLVWAEIANADLTIGNADSVRTCEAQSLNPIMRQPERHRSVETSDRLHLVVPLTPVLRRRALERTAMFGSATEPLDGATSGAAAPGDARAGVLAELPADAQIKQLVVGVPDAPSSLRAPAALPAEEPKWSLSPDSAGSSTPVGGTLAFLNALAPSSTAVDVRRGRAAVTDPIGRPSSRYASAAPTTTRSRQGY